MTKWVLDGFGGEFREDHPFSEVNNDLNNVNMNFVLLIFPSSQEHVDFDLAP